jgi:hypothetical protein
MKEKCVIHIKQVNTLGCQRGKTATFFTITDFVEIVERQTKRTGRLD